MTCFMLMENNGSDGFRQEQQRSRISYICENMKNTLGKVF